MPTLYDFWDKPLEFIRAFWPDDRLYREEEMLLESLRENVETYVPAANKMGKDYSASFGVIWYFCTRHPCRIVTTSAKDEHLMVLWGEIGDKLRRSKYPLTDDRGGFLIFQHQSLRKLVPSPYNPKQLERCEISYCKGMVAGPDSIAAMGGHHVANPGDGIPRTLLVADESSSVADEYYKTARPWSDRRLFIGNTWPCENFFKKAIKGDMVTADPGGDLPNPSSKGLFRKVIQIKAEQSPNVQYALAEIKAGREPSNRILIPGVKTWEQYVTDRKYGDPIWQSVSLDAEFYEGAEVMLYPPAWLDRAHALWISLQGKARRARSGGCDPGEGGANTSMWAVDEFGVIEGVSRKTPDTSAVTAEAIAFIRKHNIPPEKFVFDRGGGGKEHADRMRSQGFHVQTVAFGESWVPQPKRGMTFFEERIDQKEHHYAYRNRRAEMFGDLRQLLDPSIRGAGSGIEKVLLSRSAMPEGFAIPPPSAGEVYARLRHQLTKFPLKYDPEGRMELPPKNHKDPNNPSKVVTLVQLIGYSPDEADGLVLAVRGLLGKASRPTAGAPTN